MILFAYNVNDNVNAMKGSEIMFKKRIALLLAALMLASSFAACGTQGATVTDAPDAPDATGTTEAVTTTELVTTLKQADVPDVKYDGADFNIWVGGNVTYRDFTYTDTDTVLDNAIYRRNEAISEGFDVKFVVSEKFSFGNYYGSGPGYQEVMRLDKAGENPYDVSFVGTHDVCALATQGVLENLNDVPYVELDNEWWDQKANEQLEISGVMPYTTGSITTIVDQFTFCILFNKRIAEEMKLDLYSLVKEGKWTVDKWGEITSQISEDVNGDDVMDMHDKYGSLTWNDSLLGVINATGLSIASLNDNGEITLNVFDERISSMIDKYTSYAYTNNCFNIQTIATDRTATRRNMFIEERALFWLYNVGDDNIAFRNSETLEYGFLPYFKLDENQKEYANHIQEAACYFMCVPRMVTDIEKSGVLIEAMAAESYYTVRPAYFEKQLVGTYIQDEESAEMLEIIFATRIFDLGGFYQVGGYTTGLLTQFLNKSTSYTTFFESRRRVADANIAKINDSIKSHIIGE